MKKFSLLQIKGANKLLISPKFAINYFKHLTKWPFIAFVDYPGPCKSNF